MSMRHYTGDPEMDKDQIQLEFWSLVEEEAQALVPPEISEDMEVEWIWFFADLMDEFFHNGQIEFEMRDDGQAWLTTADKAMRIMVAEARNHANAEMEYKYGDMEEWV